MTGDRDRQTYSDVMSTIKHPVGPQSSKVYWRRRLVVGLGLLAVLVIIFLIIVRPGSSSGDPTSTNPPAATDVASDASTGAAGGTGAASGTAGGACAPGVVQIDAITDAVDYAADVEPLLTLSITNTGTVPCTLNAGTAAQVFTISSGDDIYWTSTDCQTDAADAEITLEPGVAVSSSSPVAWDRTRSSTDTCADETRDAAPAGGASYYLSVSVDGIESKSSTQFLLN